MRRRLTTALVVVVGMLVPVGASAPAFSQQRDGSHQGRACTLKILAALNLETMLDGRVTVPVQFEGHDHRLMVDTGGYLSTITRDLALEEGYEIKKTRGLTEIGMGTSFLDSYVQAKDFVIGHSHGKDFEFFVDDMGSLLMEGTLAPSTLAAYDVDFDFGHDKLNLINPDHCPGQVVYWTKSPAAVIPMEIQHKTHIRVPVTIDGKEITAIFDTGSITSYITQRAAQKLLGLDEKSAGMKLIGNQTINNMNGPVYNFPFQALTFGDVTVNRPHIQIVSDRVWRDNDLILGVGILRQLHFYIAYGEKKLYITPALAN
jgi:predicted aspartyl protease